MPQSLQETGESRNFLKFITDVARLKKLTTYKDIRQKADY